MKMPLQAKPVDRRNYSAAIDDRLSVVQSLERCNCAPGNCCAGSCTFGACVGACVPNIGGGLC
jgi:hypothetical protein